MIDEERVKHGDVVAQLTGSLQEQQHYNNVRAHHKGDLKNGLVRYLNGRKQSDPRMLRFKPWPE